MRGLFSLKTENPNDVPGGGGCLCGDVKNEDQSGPFFVFEGTETESNISPFPVVCAGCVGLCHDELKNLVKDADVIEEDVSRG